MTHRFIDTHCHFDFPPFAADEVASLARAAQAGVGRIIVPAISAERFSRVLALAAQHEALYAALGMHPIVIEEHTDEGLAQHFGLPVLLHVRRSADRVLKGVRAVPGLTGIAHAFSGSLQQAERFVQLGYKIGVGGTITYPRASKTREVMARLPLSALLLETDAPDMPLNGFQGQPNRPEQAARVFEALCELRPESPAAIEEGIMHNTLALFSLPPVSVC